MNGLIAKVEDTPECSVCSTKHVKIQRFSNRDGYIIDCPRCGRFAITGTLIAVMKSAPQADRMKLSALLCERTILGLAPVVLMTEECQDKKLIDGFYPTGWKFLVDHEFPRSTSERFDRALRNLSRLADPGKYFDLSQHGASLCYAENDDVWDFVLSSLMDAQLIQPRGPDRHPPYRLTAQGWNRVADVERGFAALKYQQAFVAMWFDPSLDQTWRDGFVPGIETGTNIKAVRVDLKEHNEKICDVIVAEIRKSSFLVADFTGDRGGVYFEAGFAKGLGIPVIFSCQKGEWEKKLHFDTRQYNHIIWETPADLAAKLKNRIAATIPVKDERYIGV